MRPILVSLFICAAALGVNAQQKLVWADEFDKPGLPDSKKWGYDVGDHGWGNQEKQNYTDADSNNAVVRNGSLFITAMTGGGG